MLQIAICDDEPAFCRQVAEYSERLSESLEIPVSISIYTSPMELLSRDSLPDVLFLDIQMGEYNGIEIAREIRKRSSDLVLIFMTNYIQYAIEGYTVQAYRYLLKPITYTQFCDEVRDVFALRRKREPVPIHTASGDYFLAVEDIRYIETAYGKKLLIHSNQGILETNGTLSPWESVLGNNFFRVHNSFLVNMKDIRKLETNSIFLSTGECIPLSRHRRNALQSALMNYVRNGSYT